MIRQCWLYWDVGCVRGDFKVARVIGGPELHV